MFCLLFLISFAKSENVLMTEVFGITIEPSLFNWTYEGVPDQYVYQPSLLNSPDLPSWINYRFNTKHHFGILFGVPPKKNTGSVTLEIVALNRKTYDTRRHILPIKITEKLNPAKNEVQLKIDNVNVEDMFDSERMERLKDLFRKFLWKDSEEDLYVTFLASAIQLGARLPANPSDGEGVVLRLGSRAPFSVELQELQNEVKPLWKFVQSCPRNFKRTTVEKDFRSADFSLDWCAFRLFEDNNTAADQSSTNVEKLLNVREEASFEDRWFSIKKNDVPQRSYAYEFTFTILLPMFIMLLLALLLSFILCFHHEGISKQMKDIPKHDANQYASIHRATQSLRNLSNNRDILSPELSLLASRSHTGSPTSTMGRGMHCRPSPPPYVRPKFKPDL